MTKENKQKIRMSFGEDNNPGGKAGHPPQTLHRVVQEFEKQFILNALEKNLGHKGKTSAMLGIDRKTLYTKLKKYEMM